MEFSDGKTIFIQIRDRLVDQILTGKLLPGDKIPSVRELAVDLEVNRNTVMRSYALMENEGIVDNKRGIGFFVSEQARERLIKDEKELFLKEELPKLVHQAKVLKMVPADFKMLLDQLNENQNENK
ncbi:GntR family transcriptional regulator [Belliella aquatica]|uniref:GntR family transcriptional regulator n=1 Tax=Belliella aquatica TaxID=1323734 RepID=A0ABQ1MU57_9BACT|nr:GntR family transcriptional regulator [Belliella aquatica]MCH7406543.1 GntR family transcriptional regulator [Belliella aquatica]GGC46807.1 GntR family transcriptional regulator [Belliella aquatica]